MNKLLVFCILATVLQLSMQIRIWPPMPPAQPQDPETAERFPPTSDIDFHSFCSFAFKNCHKFQAPRDQKMCLLAARHCVSDFNDYCPARLGVCKKFDRICREQMDPQFQHCCNLKNTSCVNVMPMEFPAVASQDTNAWCGAIMPACRVNLNPGDCRLKNPNCILFGAACNANVSTEPDRAKKLCNRLSTVRNNSTDVMSATAGSYYGDFNCARFTNP